ncbi:MAG: zinc-dependent metalloprotease [candidate division KSB1 bacterium]|nr:zinc-dependent metalloprotease [candidate division KSB1 bacterium]MDZ7407524.1 zinc-dependent metalloprotease [candidate division KSB1 bacterium]
MFFYFLSLSSVSAQSTQPKALFEQVLVEQTPLSAPQAKILDYIQKDTATIRFAVVKINPALFLEEKTINLNLFPNENFTTTTNKIDQRGEQDFSWHGNAPGHFSNILLTVYKEAVAGYIIIDDDYFNVRSIGNGLHVLIQVDPRKSARCGTGAASNSNASSRDNNTAFARGEIFKSSTTNHLAKTMSNTIIKVLVAYTTAAKNLAGEENGITAIINSAKDAANISYTNSAVAIELQIAHTEEVNYSETSASVAKTPRYCSNLGPFDLSVMLTDFQAGNGAMASIPNLRGLYGGDVAVLLVAPGFLPGNDNGQAFEINVPADEAFCVVNYDQAAAAGAWTFAHEIGHLQGCRHDKAADKCNDPYPHGHGYFLPNTNWRTMMAVGSGTRIQHWSNPNIFYQGVRTGDTTTANNALVLTQRAGTVANFVEEISGTISSNKTISGIASLTANVTVSSGVTLTMAATAQVFFRDGVSLTINSGANLIINAGAKLKFASGARIIVNGKITADSNDPNKRITFTGTTATPGFWNGITINSGSSTNVSTLRRCDVQYATTGITITYTG